MKDLFPHLDLLSRNRSIEFNESFQWNIHRLRRTDTDLVVKCPEPLAKGQAPLRPFESKDTVHRMGPYVVFVVFFTARAGNTGSQRHQKTPPSLLLFVLFWSGGLSAGSFGEGVKESPESGTPFFCVRTVHWNGFY
jgi:hypothetical protein